MAATSAILTTTPIEAQFQEAAEAFAQFDPRTTRWSAANALAMAHAANLAYKDPDTLQAAAAACGFTRAVVRSVRDVQACVLVRDDAVVLAFRGSRPDQLADWLLDGEIGQLDFGARLAGVAGAAVVPEVGHTHSGFTNGLAWVWSVLKDDLAAILADKSRVRTLWVAGHSLGGALAHLATATCTFLHRWPVNGLYTFGQPRVGDLTFGRNCDAHFGNLYFRFVNNEDIVTRVPPRVVAVPPCFYGHAGQVLYFDDDGVLHSDEHWWNEFLLRFDFTLAQLRGALQAPVADHDLLLGYAAHIVKYQADVASGQRAPLTW